MRSPHPGCRFAVPAAPHRPAPAAHATLAGLVTLAALALGGCGDDLGVPPARLDPPDPTLGVQSPALAALLVEHWQLEVALDPFTGTIFGEHRVDALLPPVRREELTQLRAARRELLTRANALSPAALGPEDALTYGVLIERLTAAAALDACDYERWASSPRMNPVSALDQVGAFHPLLVKEDAESYLARIAAMPAWLDEHGAQLAAGAAAGQTSGSRALGQMISSLRGWADRPPSTWPMVMAIHEGYLREGTRDALVEDVSDIIARQLAPAYRRLAVTLESQVRPAARQLEGLAGLPQGAACYAAEIRRHTTLPMTSAELHALGLSEVARIEAEIVALGQQLYGVSTLAAVRGRLDADASQRFSSEKELLEWVQGIITRSVERTAPLFAHLPATPLELVPYPAEIGQVAASYQGSADGVQPARYFLVTQPPQAQARWALESTTYHEALPGHHLQIARAAELAVPLLRDLTNDTAYVEGWGLYAETLAGEIDLFTSGPSKLGRLANEALRACRLVVDTGLHGMGWSQEQAIAFMEAHSMFGGGFVASEVARYSQWPGQALAYKVGELELLRLRAEMATRDGAAFSLRAFHEAVLERGSLPLPVLASKLLGVDDVAARTPSGHELAVHGGGWQGASGAR